MLRDTQTHRQLGKLEGPGKQQCYLAIIARQEGLDMKMPRIHSILIDEIVMCKLGLTRL